MKAPELRCTWHQGVVCMANGTLHLVQMVLPGTEGYDGNAVVPVGSFCTIHALYSWLAAQGAMTTQRNAMEAKRRPPPANPDARPTVVQRRTRPSLMGRTQ